MLESQRNMLSRVPVRRSEADAEWIEGELLLYNHSQAQAVYLNPSAAVIWSLCDGETRVQDIIEIVQDAYPEIDANLEDEIVAAVSDLEKSGAVVVG